MGNYTLCKYAAVDQTKRTALVVPGGMDGMQERHGRSGHHMRQASNVSSSRTSSVA